MLIVDLSAGHGYDRNQCAEFCPSSHHFMVNGHEHTLNFSTAGANARRSAARSSAHYGPAIAAAATHCQHAEPWPALASTACVRDALT